MRQESASTEFGQCNLLFVYGTLRTAAASPLRDLLNMEAEPLGKARVSGRLFKVDWYPGAVKSSNASDQVIGELFRLKTPDAVLRQLDEYEGVGPRFSEPTEYIRRVESVFRDDGSRVEAWVYWYARSTENLQRIESGDFLPSSG